MSSSSSSGFPGQTNRSGLGDAFSFPGGSTASASSGESRTFQRLTLSPQTIDWDRTWEVEIRPQVLCLLSCQTIDRSALFSSVYKITTALSGPTDLHPTELLYDALSGLFRSHCQGVASTLRSSSCSSSSSLSSLLLRDYLKAWKVFESGAQALNSAFHFFNSRWISKQRASMDQAHSLIGLPNAFAPGRSTSATKTYSTIGHLAIQMWKSEVLDALRHELVSVMTSLVLASRDSHLQEEDEQITQFSHHLLSINDLENHAPPAPGDPLAISYASRTGRSSSSSSSSSSESFQLYTDLLLSPLIQETRRYYQAKYSSSNLDHDIDSFLSSCAFDLHAESVRKSRYLDQSSHSVYDALLFETILYPHLDRLAEHFQTCLGSHDLPRLEQLFQICSADKLTLNRLASVYTGFLAQLGSEQLRSISLDPSARPDASDFFQKISGLYQSSIDLVCSQFRSHSLLMASIDDGFHRILNSPDATQVPDLLAQFSDGVMRGTGDLGHLEVDFVISRILILFNFLEQKDRFKAVYSKLFARRLIQSSSVSLAQEQATIAGLQESCGFEFTSSLQKMLSDVLEATDLNAKFCDWVDKSPLSPDSAPLPRLEDGRLVCSILLLTYGSWPLQTSPPLRLSASLERYLSAFSAFHSSLSDRPTKLTWLHHVSYGTLTTHFTDKRYFIRVTDFQMAVLVLFNERSALTMAQICDETLMTAHHCRKILFSLVLTKILRKNPPIKEFHPEDQYSLNLKFQNKKVNLDASRVLSRDSEDHRARRAASEASMNALHAFLVRLLKMRKVASMQSLLEEAMSNTDGSFLASPTNVNNAIAFLVAKGIVEKSEMGDGLIRYKA